MRWIFILTLLLATTAHSLSKQDEHCMAYAVYKEANAEKPAGRAVVRDVIYNRAIRHGKSICFIVAEKGQFTFTGKKKNIVASKLMLTRYREIANIKSGLTRDYVYFFNKRLHPSWAKKMKCKIVGQHKVCRP